MNERTCNTCLFLDQCTHRAVCDNWAPGTDKAEEDTMRELCESTRLQYWTDWILYASEFSG